MKKLAILTAALLVAAAPVFAGEGKCTHSTQECLDYIEEVWTDMRPLSLRQRMSKHEAARRQAERDGR